MERRRKKATSLSKWIGSLGRFGTPCPEYFISEAAKELGCSYIELESHDERERLMSIAFTLSTAKANGEHMLQCNPEFVRMQNQKQKDLQKAQKKGG